MRLPHSKQLKGLFFGVCVCLVLISVVLFCAGVARWSQYSLGGYRVEQAFVLSSYLLLCSNATDSSPALFVPVFSVLRGMVTLSNASCLGLASLSFPPSPLDEAQAAASSLLSPSSPVPVFAPSQCVPWANVSETANCDWNSVNLAYPSYSPVFVSPGSAQADAGYWLGIWIAFLLVFVFATPVVLVAMARACKSPPETV